MTSERGIERDLSGTVVLVDAMLSSVQLQTTGCKFVVLRGAGSSLAQRKGCAGAKAPTPHVVRLESSILQKDRYAFVGQNYGSGIPSGRVRLRRLALFGRCLTDEFPTTLHDWLFISCRLIVH
jgi:hypothetical protein